MRPFHLKEGDEIMIIKDIQQPLLDKLSEVPSFHVLRKTQNMHVVPSESIFKVIDAISRMI